MTFSNEPIQRYERQASALCGRLGGHSPLPCTPGGPAGRWPGAGCSLATGGLPSRQSGATDWVAIKTRWGLAVDPTEQAALTDVLANCPNTAITVALAR